MSEPKIEYRVDAETIHGGKMTYVSENRDKAEAFFIKAKESDDNLYGTFRSAVDEGEWETIDEFDRRPEPA